MWEHVTGCHRRVSSTAGRWGWPSRGVTSRLPVWREMRHLSDESALDPRDEGPHTEWRTGRPALDVSRGCWADRLTSLVVLWCHYSVTGGKLWRIKQRGTRIRINFGQWLERYTTHSSGPFFKHSSWISRDPWNHGRNSCQRDRCSSVRRGPTSHLPPTDRVYRSTTRTSWKFNLPRCGLHGRRE